MTPIAISDWKEPRTVNMMSPVSVGEGSRTDRHDLSGSYLTPSATLVPSRGYQRIQDNPELDDQAQSSIDAAFTAPEAHENVFIEERGGDGHDAQANAYSRRSGDAAATVSQRPSLEPEDSTFNSGSDSRYGHTNYSQDTSPPSTGVDNSIETLPHRQGALGLKKEAPRPPHLNPTSSSPLSSSSSPPCLVLPPYCDRDDMQNDALDEHRDRHDRLENAEAQQQVQQPEVALGAVSSTDLAKAAPSTIDSERVSQQRGEGSSIFDEDGSIFDEDGSTRELLLSHPDGNQRLHPPSPEDGTVPPIAMRRRKRYALISCFKCFSCC
jgi:hypothetical protein